MSATVEKNQERKVDRLYVGWTDKQKERERERRTDRTGTHLRHD